MNIKGDRTYKKLQTMKKQESTGVSHACDHVPNALLTSANPKGASHLCKSLLPPMP